MAFRSYEAAEYERLVFEFVEERRPPPSIRNELDLSYRLQNQSVEILEIRPAFRNPKEMVERAVAKATFVRSRGVWRVFWLRRDLKWHGYDPTPEVERLEDFLALVDRDECCCFFG